MSEPLLKHLELLLFGLAAMGAVAAVLCRSQRRLAIVALVLGQLAWCSAVIATFTDERNHVWRWPTLASAFFGLGALAAGYARRPRVAGWCAAGCLASFVALASFLYLDRVTNDFEDRCRSAAWSVLEISEEAMGLGLAGLTAASIVMLGGAALSVRQADGAPFRARLVALGVVPWVLSAGLFVYAVIAEKRLSGYFDAHNMANEHLHALGRWPALLVAAALGASLLLLRHRDAEKSSTTNARLVTGGVALALGVAAFAMTRSRAHDARQVVPVARGAQLWRDPANVPALPETVTCDRIPEEPVLELSPDGVTVDGTHVDSPMELVAFLRRRDELSRGFNPQRDPPRRGVGVQVGAGDPPAVLVPFVRAVAENDLGTVRLHVQQVAPPVPTETLGLVPRARRCAIPLRLAPEGAPVRTWQDAADAIGRGEPIGL